MTSDWTALLRRTWKRIELDQVTVVAAGVAFYLLLAVFPGIAALVSTWGIVSDPAEIGSRIDALPVPPQAGALLTAQLERVSRNRDAVLGLGLAAGVLLGLASASRGMKALITALNLCYGVRETRGWLRRTAVSLLLALGAIAGGTVVLSVVVGLPVLLDRVGLGFGLLASAVSWIVLGAGVMTMIAVLYRFAPDRRRRRWVLLSPGTALATGLWIVGSLAFTVYAAHFASFNRTYGSVGGVVVLLLWLWLGTLATLLGAEVDAASSGVGRRVVGDGGRVAGEAGEEEGRGEPD
ncbi:MAG TPA: YihY/virulence factor BrkB family protein [bacterium]|nr:YihY/virulence factor BrkB family protein [bacterium]